MVFLINRKKASLTLNVKEYVEGGKEEEGKFNLEINFNIDGGVKKPNIQGY